MNTLQKKIELHAAQAESYRELISIYQRQEDAATRISESYRKLGTERELTGEELLAWAKADQTIFDARIEKRIAQETADEYNANFEKTKVNLQSILQTIENGEFERKRLRLKELLGKAHTAKIKPANLNDYIDVLSAITEAESVDEKVDLNHKLNNAVSRLATVLDL